MKNAVKKLNIKTKVVLCLLVLTLVPQMLLLRHLYTSNRASLLQVTSGNIHQLVRSNNALLDETLKIIKETTMNIMVDTELFEIFLAAQEAGVEDDVAMQRNVQPVLAKYFGSLSGVEQVEIITRQNSYVLYGRKSQFLHFFQSDVFHRIESGAGAIAWLTAQDMDEYKLEKSYPSCARLMNLTFVDRTSGISRRLPADENRPVIRVILSVEDLHENLQKNITTLSDATYFLVDGRGEIMLTGGVPIEEGLSTGQWKDLVGSRSGVREYQLEEGGAYIFCYDTLAQSGWTGVAAFPQAALAKEMTESSKRVFIACIITMSAATLACTLLVISLISKRIRKLTQGVDELKRGNFATEIRDDRKDEFSRLIDDFNRMSRTLRQLIDENYKARISQQEAQLQILTTQLNPHYIYNTLNIINFFAIKEQAKHTSKLIVALSRMLQYTSDNKTECTLLQEDILWLENYLLLMGERFVGLFTVRWHMDPDCLRRYVPKLFIQPLLENSILHGFEGRTSGGEIDVIIEKHEGCLCCRVEDNGVGMTEEKARQLLRGEGSSIGLYNVHRRIQLLYGEAYGLRIDSEPGRGCRILARMPLQDSPERPGKPFPALREKEIT